MYIDQKVYTGRPEDRRSAQEEAIYDKLDELGIAFERVDHEAANTMEDCRLVEATLGSLICKNLFLCNRQCTEFYLLMMPGDKPFKTKYLTSQLNCARLSFGSPEAMKEFLQTIPGSASVLELIFDTEKRVKLVIDRDLLQQETISGHPGFSTSTLKLKKEDILKYAEASGHSPALVNLPKAEEIEA